MHIVSLGSSFAAGPGISPISSRSAMRSSNNYPTLFAASLKATLTDLTVSGATLQNILSEPQKMLGTKFPPQATQVPADAEVVTITAGGNDMGYIGGMIADAAKSYVPAFAMGMMPALGGAREVGVKLGARDVAERLVAVIDEVHRRAPGARILLVQYLTVVGEQTKAGVDVPFDEGCLRRAVDVGRELDEAYVIAAGEREVAELVPVAELSEGHCLGSEDPWVGGFSPWLVLSGGPVFHPNARGMEAVAEILAEHISSEEKDEQRA